MRANFSPAIKKKGGSMMLGGGGKGSGTGRNWEEVEVNMIKIDCTMNEILKELIKMPHL